MRYQASLEKKLEETKILESGSLDMNIKWNNVKEMIIAAGEEVMGTTTMQKRKVEWFDEECREKIAKKKKPEEGCYRKKQGVDMRNIRNYRKMIRRSVKRKRKNIYRSKLRK